MLTSLAVTRQKMKNNYKNKKTHLLFKTSAMILMFVFLLSSCTIQMRTDISSNEKKKTDVKFKVQNIEQKEYVGWWVYGEGQHIFKDEQTLEEYDVEFLNENMDELAELYIAVCEMEFFPLECKMTGRLKKELVDEQDTLMVSAFEILYVEGWGE